VAYDLTHTEHDDFYQMLQRSVYSSLSRHGHHIRLDANSFLLEPNNLLGISGIIGKVDLPHFIDATHAKPTFSVGVD
jgi:hypothetical protein